MLLTPFLFGGLGWLVYWGAGANRAEINTLKPRVEAIESNANAIAGVQASRAKDSEDFQSEVRNAISDLKASQRATNTALNDMKGDVFQTKVDVAAIKLLLQRQTNTTALLTVPPELRIKPER